MSKERAGLTPGETDVLIVVDVQYDFLPGGALAVPDGDAVRSLRTLATAAGILTEQLAD